MDEVETSVVARDLAVLARHRRAHYHLLHVSTPESVRLIAFAKAQGLRVTCEVTPHHLWFCSEDVKPANTSFCMNPPLRSRAHQKALREQLAAGDIDWVATDHAPHESRAKGDDFKQAAFGTTGIETSLRVLLALVDEGVLTPSRLVEVFSLKPAQFLKLPEFGRLSSQHPFRAVVVAYPSERTPVLLEEFYGLARNSCFIGESLPPGPILHATQKGLFGGHSAARDRGLLEVSP